MEVICESLIHENSEIESPEWHQDIHAVRKPNIEKKGKLNSSQLKSS